MNSMNEVLLAYLRQIMKSNFYSSDKDKMNLVYLSKPVDLKFEIVVLNKYIEII